MKISVQTLFLGLTLFCCSSVIASASPNLIIDNPVRPASSARIKATVGLVESYQLVATDSLLAAQLRIYDELAKTVRTFSLSFVTRVNNKVLKCSDNSRGDFWATQGEIQRYGLCHSLPAIQPGKTRVVILYWEPEHLAQPVDLLDIANQGPASDELWTVTQ